MTQTGELERDLFGGASQSLRSVSLFVVVIVVLVVVLVDVLVVSPRSKGRPVRSRGFDGKSRLQGIAGNKRAKLSPTTSTNSCASVKPKLFVNVDGGSLFLVQDVVLNGVTFCCKELIPDLLSAISQCL